ncbi:hypothetical protein HK097_003818 [Rhizophlyctis rosea]|uniref:Uncharacterized protein n=1 Tax=Rhizophlyctis rosea TaxID=64517 RepID=A0AAD5SFA2_9FUNG|nr:hypothetical protein HK097_003818 [Rhizophlyctis rosea]
MESVELRQGYGTSIRRVQTIIGRVFGFKSFLCPEATNMPDYNRSCKPPCHITSVGVLPTRKGEVVIEETYIKVTTTDSQIEDKGLDIGDEMSELDAGEGAGVLRTGKVEVWIRKGTVKERIAIDNEKFTTSIVSYEVNETRTEVAAPLGNTAEQQGRIAEMNVTSGDHWREIFDFCDVNTLIILSRTTKAWRVSLGLPSSPLLPSDKGEKSGDELTCEKNCSYLNRRILSALLSPYLDRLDSLPAALPAVLQPAWVAKSPSNAQHLVFSMFQMQRQIILEIYTKLLTFYEKPEELWLPLWSIGQDHRKEYLLKNIERRVDAGQYWRAHELTPTYPHHFPNYNSATLDLPCLKSKPLLPLDAIFFARYFQNFLSKACLPDMDVINIKVPTSEDYHSSSFPNFSADRRSAPRGKVIEEAWDGGWWQSSEGEWKLLLKLGCVGADNERGDLYLDCTPGLTSTSHSTSSTYGAVYNHWKGAPVTHSIHLLAHSLTDLLYAVLIALEHIETFEGEVTKWKEGYKLSELDDLELPEGARTVADGMLTRAQSVWVERAGLVDKVRKLRVVLINYEVTEFLED